MKLRPVRRFAVNCKSRGSVGDGELCEPGEPHHAQQFAVNCTSRDVVVLKRANRTPQLGHEAADGRAEPAGTACLGAVAGSRGFLAHLRIGMLRALNRHVEGVFNLPRHVGDTELFICS
jgi:hypothetical protein